MPTFDLSQSAEFQKWLDAGLKAAVDEGLLMAGHHLVEHIQTEVIPNEKPQPVDMSAYRNAWRAEPTKNGVDVVNDMPYASIIEHGVRAANIKIGRKMIDALAEWAQRKGLTGRGGGTADARKIAWAIARKMQGTATKEGTGIFNRDGQEGLHIAEKAMKRVGDFARSEIADAIKRYFG